MKAIVLFSGGLDSTVLLYGAIQRVARDQVGALSVDYGQRHVRELAVGARIAERVGVQRKVVDLSCLRDAGILRGSSQTDPSVAVPHGHYADASMKLTVVPNRNMILLAIATAWAIAENANDVLYAAHAGDHPIYPDCRPAFVKALGLAIGLASDDPTVLLFAPFQHMTKADIVRQGADLGVPFGETWSCYEGGDVHCGRCGTCVERREAFQVAGVVDPTTYAG